MATKVSFDEAPRMNAWAQWTLRGLLQLGGSSTPRDLEAHLATQLEGQLSRGQIARVMKNNYFRWGSHELKKAGLVGGEYGIWALTARGREVAERRLADPIELPDDIEELPPEEANYNGPTESVQVTSFDGFVIPLLRVLEKAPLSKQEVVAAFEKTAGKMLLPGDRRLMPSGHPVWRYRASWALTNMKKDGLIGNDGKAVWTITASGRQRLIEEGKTWALDQFQNSKATVRVVGTPAAPSEEAEDARWPTVGWLDLVDEVPEQLIAAVSRRLRPELGPAPELERGSLPRNIVFYGPPGTGKTHVASRFAAALTEEKERVEDGAWRFVQFHPSYSYEDFVQGLRPDLKQKELRYEVKKGPFVSLCEAASEDPDNFYVLVIDEINRGDPARIFGELLYALEYRGEPISLAMGGQLVVPPNVVVIGTMNSVDRSVALVDYALRRRFAFIRLDPDPGAIRRVLGDSPGARRAATALDRLNAWLTKRLDREHVIGHSFFLNPAIELAGPQALDGVWREDLLPLLEEYFVGDVEGLAAATTEWGRILAAVSAE